MDYEKKYKQLHKFINDLYPHMSEYCKEKVCGFLPELKESEDERIRKELLDYLDERRVVERFTDTRVKEEWIDWLKKQGKETSWKPSKEEMDVLYGLSYITNEFDERKEEVITRLYQDLKREFFNGASFENMFSTNTSVELEKQGEQKPTDEVKPKFKIEKGKWYVCIRNLYDNYANKAFCEGDPYLSTQDGNLIPCNSNVPYKVTCPDTHFRDWTIQDAKDGDVLVAEIDKEPNDFIYIFKEYNKNLGFWSHCYLDAYINKFHEGKYHNNLNVGVPATKEQRDLLFQKMHEEGYEWDAEKKELKKIEQKPVWSEEDKDALDIAIRIIQNGGDDCSGILDSNKALNWLNSLKERVQPQPKQEWGEEDEKILNVIINDIQERHLEAMWEINVDNVVAVPTKYIIDWLKSLKTRFN